MDNTLYIGKWECSLLLEREIQVESTMESAKFLKQHFWQFKVYRIELM